MLVIAYDVNTANPDGARRLRAVAKICERYGMRVQNSVFEVLVDEAQLTALKKFLLQTIDVSQDSVRLYRLGNNYQNKIDKIGCTPIVETGKEFML